MAFAGTVKIAELNWQSGSMLANIDAIIIEKGYGHDVEIIPGGTEVTINSMLSNGTPDIFSEAWVNLLGAEANTALSSGTLGLVTKDIIAGAGEGFYIPSYILEANPELTSFEAVLARPDLFPHPEDPSKGGFHICPPGWNCELSNRNHFRAWGMEAKGWMIVETGSAAGLDGSIAKAAERGENWFGYYWSPTALIGKYNMQAVDMGEFAGKDNWDNCLVKPEQECANPKKSSWVKSEVFTITTDNFKKTAGKDGMKYLENRTYPGPVMNGMLVWMGENQAEGADAAIEFLKTQESVWSKWVSSDAAKKIKKAL